MSKDNETKAEKDEDKKKAEEKPQGVWGTPMQGSSADYDPDKR